MTTTTEAAITASSAFFKLAYMAAKARGLEAVNKFEDEMVEQYGWVTSLLILPEMSSVENVLRWAKKSSGA